jgi:hypothetical protein
MGVTIADDVAMSVQYSLIHHTTTSVVHIANAISRSKSALVHELMQLAIHHFYGKGKQQWGVQYGGGCGLFAFDTKGPPFHWLTRPSAPSSTAPGPLSAGPIEVDWCPKDLFPCSHLDKGSSFQFLMLPMGARRPTNSINPGTGDCIDVSAAGREEFHSYHQLDEVTGRPMTDMVGVWVPQSTTD